MKDMMAHWNELESISVGLAVLALDRRTLAQSVFQAADVGDWPKSTTGGNSVPAAVLRSVIIYCLATNVCSSEEIVDASQSDPTVRYLCANHSLDWQTVHEFRKRHTLLIRDSLAHLLLSICGARANSHLKRDARLEADHRIRRAVQADSTVLDL